MNAEYDLLDAADICWRLGRYEEARQTLAAAGPSASRAAQAVADQIRAAMALSQRQFAGALEIGRRVLAQNGLDIAVTAAAKSTLSLAQIASGARREGLAAAGEAAQLAGKSGSGLLIAETGLAHAEALLAAGDARPALDAALDAGRWFAGAGNQEAEWRSWFLAARAESTLSHAEKSREDAGKAGQLLATLEQKWDADSYKTYLSRPDIEDARSQLAKLTGAR
jgi:hypothetical protein